MNAMMKLQASIIAQAAIPPAVAARLTDGARGPGMASSRGLQMRPARPLSDSEREQLDDKVDRAVAARDAWTAALRQLDAARGSSSVSAVASAMQTELSARQTFDGQRMAFGSAVERLNLGQGGERRDVRRYQQVADGLLDTRSKTSVTYGMLVERDQSLAPVDAPVAKAEDKAESTAQRRPTSRG